MLDGVSGLVIYLCLKFAGYTCWSYVGLRWFGPQPPRVSGALMRGVARLMIGWVTGVIVGPFVLLTAGTNHLSLFYFTGLAFVRWFEWGIIHFSFSTADSEKNIWLAGGSPRGRLWRFVGILISYLADAPFLLAEGFPSGRIFC
jgi:hypothetical protein